jgi:hypothetical protein
VWFTHKTQRGGTKIPMYELCKKCGGGTQASFPHLDLDQVIHHLKTQRNAKDIVLEVMRVQNGEKNKDFNEMMAVADEGFTLKVALFCVFSRCRSY